HKVPPSLRMALQGGDQRLALLRFYAVGFEDFRNLVRLDFGFLHDFSLLADALAGIMLCIAAGGEISTQSHGNRAGSNLCQPGDYHNVARGNGAGESRSQREGDGKSIGHTDDHIAHFFSASKVPFNMDRLMHRGFSAPSAEKN